MSSGSAADAPASTDAPVASAGASSAARDGAAPTVALDAQGSQRPIDAAPDQLAVTPVEGIDYEPGLTRPSLVLGAATKASAPVGRLDAVRGRQDIGSAANYLVERASTTAAVSNAATKAHPNATNALKAPARAGWQRSANGTWRYWKWGDDGLKAVSGWLVTGVRPGGSGNTGLQRYWLDRDGTLVTNRLVVTGENTRAWAMGDGTILRGKLRKNGGMLLADNDGNLAWKGGWLVTGLYDGGAMHRYRIDGAPGDGLMGAHLGWFTVDGAKYFGRPDEGYVYHGGCFEMGSQWFYADAGGRVTYIASGKVGWQNPSWMYQVSAYNVSRHGSGFYSFVTPSRISPDATREDCIETFIARAFEYMGTPYEWDWAATPGTGVDCAGLVMQALYATGMDISPMNPYDHYFTAGHDQYANWMRQSSRFMHVGIGDRQRGDLVFWYGHVAIYLGDDQIIEANHPAVRVSSLWRYGTPLAFARPFV